MFDIIHSKPSTIEHGHATGDEGCCGSLGKRCERTFAGLGQVYSLRWRGILYRLAGPRFEPNRVGSASGCGRRCLVDGKVNGGRSKPLQVPVSIGPRVNRPVRRERWDAWGMIDKRTKCLYMAKTQGDAIVSWRTGRRLVAGEVPGLPEGGGRKVNFQNDVLQTA